MSRPFALQFIPKFRDAVFGLVLRYSDTELRSLNKDQLEEISDAIEKLLKRIDSTEDVAKHVEKFGLDIGTYLFNEIVTNCFV